MSNIADRQTIATHTVNGRTYEIERITWKTGGLSFDVTDKATGLCLTPESWDHEPTVNNIRALVRELDTDRRGGTLDPFYDNDYDKVRTVTATKITTTEIGRRLAARETVRILVHVADDGTLSGTAKKTGAYAATVAGIDTVAGSRQCRYQLTASAGPVAGSFSGAQTHWLARDTDPAAPIPAEEAEPTVEADAPAQDEAWTERYSAGWSDGEVTVIRDVRAGISGPFGEYLAADLDEAETVLRANGYALSGPWTEHTNGHFAPLVRVPPQETADPDPHTVTLAGIGQHLRDQAAHLRQVAATATPETAGLIDGYRTGEDLAAACITEAEAKEAQADTYPHVAGVNERETFEQQASGNGGKTWRTVAVGLDVGDVDKYRAAHETGEGVSWRFLPEGDDRARTIAAKEAELVAAEARLQKEGAWRNHGSMRTKSFGRRTDANLRRGGEAGRAIERLRRELAALRRPVREVPPLDLERLPFASHIRTDVGWYKVVKVNRKTVKVVVDPGWDDLIPIKRIIEIRERPAETSDAPTPTVFVSGWSTV